MAWLFVILAATGLAAGLAFLFSGGDPVWVVDSNDWPAIPAGEQISAEELEALMDLDWGPYHAAAVASLAETVVPGEEAGLPEWPREK